MGGQKGPRAFTQSKVALKLLKLPAEHSKLEHHDRIKGTGERVQLECAESTSSLLTQSYSTKDIRSCQFFRHGVVP